MHAECLAQSPDCPEMPESFSIEHPVPGSQDGCENILQLIG